MFQIGPMSRYVEDLALVLPILTGPDWRDPYATPVPLSDPSEVDVGGLRVATFTNNGAAEADADTVTAVKAAAGLLGESGVHVESVRPTCIERASDLFMAVLQADAGAGVRALLAEAGTSEIHPLLQQVQELQGSTSLSAVEFGALLADLDVWKGEMLSFMEKHDAILCPVTVSPSVPHGTFYAGLDPANSTFQFNLTGWPSAVVRAGKSSDGLPIGVQIVTRPWREDVALALAQRVEDALGGWQPPSI